MEVVPSLWTITIGVVIGIGCFALYKLAINYIKNIPEDPETKEAERMIINEDSRYGD